MKSQLNYPLNNKNSFNIAAVCPQIFFPASVTDLQSLPDLSQQSFYILGEGSNTLFVEETSPVIICPYFKGKSIEETDSAFIVTVACGENWHELVQFCLANGINGLENLALIPGSVGAAPVQNIGAYGVEFADYCLEISWFDFASKQITMLSASECGFAYRDSIFKQALYNKGIIISVKLLFPKKWQANLSYQGLDALPSNVTALEVMEKVITLRQSKLPDPKVIANAGSFFKNPIVDNNVLTRLQEQYPTMPFYPLNDNVSKGKQPLKNNKNRQCKLAAGWLIDQAGLKGYKVGNVGVHNKQALVLVNYASEQGKDIVNLAKYVQTMVFNKFAVHLTPEVRMITAHGEKSFDDLCVE